MSLGGGRPLNGLPRLPQRCAAYRRAHGLATGGYCKPTHQRRAGGGRRPGTIPSPHSIRLNGRPRPRRFVPGRRELGAQPRGCRPYKVPVGSRRAPPGAQTVSTWRRAHSLALPRRPVLSLPRGAEHRALPSEAHTTVGWATASTAPWARAATLVASAAPVTRTTRPRAAPPPAARPSTTSVGSARAGG